MKDKKVCGLSFDLHIVRYFQLPPNFVCFVLTQAKQLISPHAIKHIQSQKRKTILISKHKCVILLLLQV